MVRSDRSSTVGDPPGPRRRRSRHRGRDSQTVRSQRYLRTRRSVLVGSYPVVHRDGQLTLPTLKIRFERSGGGPQFASPSVGCKPRTVVRRDRCRQTPVKSYNRHYQKGVTRDLGRPAVGTAPRTRVDCRPALSALAITRRSATGATALDAGVRTYPVIRPRGDIRQPTGPEVKRDAALRSRNDRNLQRDCCYRGCIEPGRRSISRRNRAERRLTRVRRERSGPVQTAPASTSATIVITEFR